MQQPPMGPQQYPNYQQPPMQGYPPQYQQPPMKPKKKGVPRWVWIVGGIVAFFVIVGSFGSHSSTTSTTANNASSTTQVPATPVPTQVPKTWQTTHTYTGTGSQKTETFTVGDDWKIQWSCKGSVAYNIDAPLYVTVYSSDNHYVDGPSATCKASDTPTTGGTEEHQAGKFYLDINAGIDWTITIQELK